VVDLAGALGVRVGPTLDVSGDDLGVDRGEVLLADQEGIVLRPDGAIPAADVERDLVVQIDGGEGPFGAGRREPGISL
jgi:hypothetical protein